MLGVVGRMSGGAGEAVAWPEADGRSMFSSEDESGGSSLPGAVLVASLRAEAREAASKSRELASGSSRPKLGELLRRNEAVAGELERVVGLLGGGSGSRQVRESKTSSDDSAEQGEGEADSHGSCNSDEEERCAAPSAQRSRSPASKGGRVSESGSSRCTSRARQSLAEDLETLKRSHGKLGWRLAAGLDRRREVEANLGRKCRALQAQADALKAKLGEERGRGERAADHALALDRRCAVLEQSLARALQAKDAFGRTLEEETRKAWAELEQSKRESVGELRRVRDDFESARAELSRAHVELDVLRGRLKQQASALSHKSARLDHAMAHYKRELGEAKMRAEQATSRAEALAQDAAEVREALAAEREGAAAQLADLRTRLHEVELCGGELREKEGKAVQRLAAQEQRAARAEQERERERLAVGQLRAALEALRNKVQALDHERACAVERADRAEGQRDSHKRVPELEAQAAAAAAALLAEKQARQLAEADERRAQSALEALQAVAKDLYTSRNNALRLVQHLQQQQEQHEQQEQPQQQQQPQQQPQPQPQPQQPPQPQPQPQQQQQAIMTALSPSELDAEAAEALKAQVERLTQEVLHMRQTIHELSA
jgi:chromosome segregation ATPase